MGKETSQRLQRLQQGMYTMRISVTLDDELFAKAMQASQLLTERAVIEAGLQLLVRLHAQEQIRSLRGQLRWEGDLDTMRDDGIHAE